MGVREPYNKMVVKKHTMKAYLSETVKKKKKKKKKKG